MINNLLDENSTAYGIGLELSRLLKQGPTYNDLLRTERKQNNPASTQKMQQLKENLDLLLVRGSQKVDKNGALVETGTLLDPNKKSPTLSNAAEGLITPKFFERLKKLHKTLTGLQNADTQKTKQINKRFKVFREQWFQFNDLFENDSANNPLLLIRSIKQGYQKRQSLLEVNDKAARGFKDFLTQQKAQESDITPYPSFLSPREALFVEFYQDFPPAEQSKKTSKLNLQNSKLNNVKTISSIISSIIPTNTDNWTAEQWQEHAHTLLKSLAQKNTLKDLPPLVDEKDEIIYKQQQAYGSIIYEVLDNARRQSTNPYFQIYQQLASWHVDIANQNRQQANQQSAVDSLRDQLGMNNSPDLARLKQLQSQIGTYIDALPSPKTTSQDIQESNTNVVRGGLNIVLFEIGQRIQKKDPKSQPNQKPRTTSTSSTSTQQSGDTDNQPNSRLTTQIALDQQQAFQAVKDYLPNQGQAQQQPFAYTTNHEAIYLNDFQQVSTNTLSDELEDDVSQQASPPQQIQYTVSQQPAHEQPKRQETIVQHLPQSSDERTTYELDQDSEMSITAALELTKRGYDKGEFVAHNNQREVDISGVNDTRARRGAPRLSEFMQQAGIDNKQRKSLTWQQYAYLQAVDLGLKPINYNQKTIDNTIQQAAQQLEERNLELHQPEEQPTPGIQSRKYS